MSAPSVRRTSPCTRAGCDRPRTARPIGGQSRTAVYTFSIRRAGASDTPHNWLGGKIGRQGAGETPSGARRTVAGGGRTGRTAVQGRGAGAAVRGGRTAVRADSCKLSESVVLTTRATRRFAAQAPGLSEIRHLSARTAAHPAHSRALCPHSRAPRTRVAPPTPRRTERARRPHHGRRRALDLLSRKPRGSHMHGTHPRGPRRADYFAASSRPTRYGKVVQQAPRFWPWNAKL